MANIGFTDKQIHVYNRFQKMRQAYQDANGRTYAWEFLTVLMDAWEKLDKVKVITFTPEMELSDFVKNVVRAVVDDIAGAEANEPGLQPVRLKDSDNRYVNNAIVATTNLFLTDDRSEAIVFDSPDKAKEFLRKCGYDVGNWILEPVN